MLHNNNLTASDYFRRAISLYKQQKLDEAIADYTKAIELNPDFVNAYYNRGIAFWYLEKMDEAIADYTKAIELDPKYSAPYHNRGAAFARHGKIAEAISDYNKAIDLKNEHSETNLKLLIDKHDKINLFRIIKTLSYAEQTQVFRKCLDKRTILGQRFWKQEGLFECNIDSGTLMQIKQHLLNLEKRAILWIGFGKELIQNADIFRVITAMLLDIDFSIVNKVTNPKNPALIFQEANNQLLQGNENINKPVFIM